LRGKKLNVNVITDAGKSCRSCSSFVDLRKTLQVMAVVLQKAEEQQKSRTN